MKQFILLLFTFLFVTANVNAATVKLKITYNGAAAQGHSVFILVGGSSLGSGVTDNNGEVQINVSSIPSKSLDLRGEKRCNNAEKKWSISGWCNLDNNNYCHIKMEEPLNEMVEGMGGMMSASTLAAAWGLTCSEASPSSSSNPSKNEAPKESSEADEKTTTAPAPKDATETQMTPQEAAAQRKVQSEQRIAAIDAKIERKQAKFEKNRESMEMDEIVMHGLEIEELQTKKELEQIELEEQTLRTTKLMLNREEREDFKTRRDEKKDRLDEINAEMKNVKNGGGSNGQIKKSEPDEVVEDEPVKAAESEKNPNESAPLSYQDMTDFQLSTEVAKLKTESAKIKTGLQLRSKKMSDEEIAEKELRIAEIDKEVDIIRIEQDSRKGK